MENNEYVEPESTQNSSENNVKPEREFTNEDLTDAIKASLFDDTTETATTEAENAEEAPEVESEGVEDTEVLSQSEEESTETSEDTQEPESAQESPEQEEDEVRVLPKGIKKRIDKLAQKRREAEEQAAHWKAEAERLKAESERTPQAKPVSNNPFANIDSPEAIQKEIEKAKQVRRWCEMNPDGGVVKDDNGNETEFTGEEVRQIKVRAMDAIEEHIPAQMRYIENMHRVEQMVAKEYTWWKDKSSAERQIAEAFMKHFPEIKRFPDYKMVLGDYIRGVKAREAASKKTAPSRPPSQPKSASAPNTASGNRSARLTNPSDMDALTSIIASKFI
jgi:hypothetical protein